MNDRERIKKAPFLVFTKARRHYYGSKIGNELIIKIEIEDQKNIGLFSMGIYQGHARENMHLYDEDGTRFFNGLMSSFGSVKVQFYDGETKHYDTYDDFLDAIIA